MNDSPIHDQWKANGNCAMCRRRNYCKTACTAAKNRSRRIGREVARKILRGEMVVKAEMPDGQEV